MSNPKAKQSCSVVGCTNPDVSLHRLPTKEDVRAKWLHFIYQGKVPASVGKGVVCANHFTDLHHLNVNIRLFLFGKVVRPGEKLYILCITFKSHTWKTTRWRYFCNAHNSHILCRTFKNLISIHAG